MLTAKNWQKAFDASVTVSPLTLKQCPAVSKRDFIPHCYFLHWQNGGVQESLNNTHEFSSYSKLVSASFSWSPVTARRNLERLAKRVELMLWQNMLMSSRTTELREQPDVTTKRNARKRRRIQQCDTSEYAAALAQIATKTYSAA